jgi:hypothetical protein
VFSSTGEPTCHIINNIEQKSTRAIVVEKGQWHAMTAGFIFIFIVLYYYYHYYFYY